MDYLSCDQVKKYIFMNFNEFDLLCLFDLSNFQKKKQKQFNWCYNNVD